jgi:hypothetical protein
LLFFRKIQQKQQIKSAIIAETTRITIKYFGRLFSSFPLPFFVVPVVVVSDLEVVVVSSFAPVSELSKLSSVGYSSLALVCCNAGSVIGLGFLHSKNPSFVLLVESR